MYKPNPRQYVASIPQVDHLQCIHVGLAAQVSLPFPAWVEGSLRHAPTNTLSEEYRGMTCSELLGEAGRLPSVPRVHPCTKYCRWLVKYSSS